jgi:dihydroceramidase
MCNGAVVAVAAYRMLHIGQFNLGKRFYLAYASVAFIGVGSWLFHMTLDYYSQLLDELPSTTTWTNDMCGSDLLFIGADLHCQ